MTSEHAASSTQAELLAGCQQARLALDDFIASRSAAERDAPRADDQWTARDLLALIGFWMDYTVERMAFYARGETPPRDVDFDALNQRTLSAYEGEPWAACVDYANAALARLTAAIAASDDALLLVNNFYGDEPGGPFRGEIQANSFTWPLQELEKYYRRVGDLPRAQATKATLTQALGADEPAIACDLTTAQALHDLGAAALIVDVRGASEYAAGHVPGAINIPLGALPDRLGELPRDRPIVTYCMMNHPGHSRGERAAALLHGQGFAASALAGGYPAWQALDSSGTPEQPGK